LDPVTSLEAPRFVIPSVLEDVIAERLPELLVSTIHLGINEKFLGQG
jgi:hypothetical protein